MLELVIDEIRFEAAHYLPGHGKCGYIHGHTYVIRDLRIKVEETDSLGISIDFGAIKEALRFFDHKLFVPSRDLEAWKNASLPGVDSSRIIAIDPAPSVEKISTYVRTYLASKFGIPESNIRFKLYEGLNQGVEIR